MLTMKKMSSKKRTSASGVVVLCALLAAATVGRSSAASVPLRPSPRSAKGEQGAPIGNVTLLPTAYPPVRRDDAVVEELGGSGGGALEVADPYRWLEDPDSPETRAFVAAQNALSRSVLDAAPARAPFRAALDRGLDFPKFGSPTLRGGRYYYSYNPGLANQASLYSVPSLDTPHERATLLIDPNTLSKDGTVALFDASFSEDGRHVSYQLSSGGSDWRTVKVMRLDPQTGKGTPSPVDDLEFVKFSSEVWTKDNLGFFYSRFPPPSTSGGNSTDLGTETDSAQGQQLWYHVVGTPQSDDALVLSIPEHPDWSIGCTVDDSGKTLYVSVSKGTSPSNRLWTIDLAAVPRKKKKEGKGAEGEEKAPLDFGALFDDDEAAAASSSSSNVTAPSRNLPLTKLVDEFEATYDYVATRSSDGKDLFMTNAGAPLYRIVVGDARSAVAAAAAGGGKSNNSNGGKKNASSSFTPIREWPDLVPQHPRDTLQFAKALKGDDALVLGYLEDVATVLKHGSLIDGLGGLSKKNGGGGDGNGTVVPLPPLGSVGDLSGDREDETLFFTYTSFVDPGTTYSYDTSAVASAREAKRGGAKATSSSSSTATATTKSTKESSSSSSSSKDSKEKAAAASSSSSPSSSSVPTSALKVFRQTEVPDYDRTQYKTERTFATSKDGTRVPVFITTLANATRDGQRPTVLYGYGGFNIAIKPSFSVSRMLWIRSFNAAYASANMRGGGEYGISWRDAGSGAFKKQKVFDDFQAAAEHLMSGDVRLTSPRRLAIQGASNGGTLVAACVNQRPDLYVAGLPTVGVHDMLRFDRFTIGHAWRTDFGDPRSGDAEELRAIAEWSPLHNVAAPTQGTKNYPALLVMTGDHDDRVPPLHSFKYAATLQHAVAENPTPEKSPQRNPILLRVETRAGHGAGKPTAKQIEELSDIYGFLAEVMGVEFGSAN